MHVIASAQVPRLSLAPTQCIIVADSPTLSVDDQLRFQRVRAARTVRALTLLLGKLRPAMTTEPGHRYLIEFDAEAIPNDVSASYAFQRIEDV